MYMTRSIDNNSNIKPVKQDLYLPKSVKEIQEIANTLKNSILYFAYGSNMNPERLKERGVEYVVRTKAHLADHRLVFNKMAKDIPGKTFANVEGSKEDTVEGILYLTNEEGIEALDRYEGAPIQYERKICELYLSTQEKLESIVYIANPNRIGEGKPTREYIAHLLVGRDVLSEEYIRQIKNVPTLD